MSATPDFLHTPLFRGLNGCDLTDLLASARSKTIARRSAFFYEQDEATQCHLLVSGQVRLVQAAAEGGRVVVRFVGAGEIFGWAMVMGASLYPGTAEAMTDCTALVWDGEALRRAMLAHPQLALNALDMVGARLREAQERLRELATERTERRLARSLLRLTTTADASTRNRVEIGFPLTRQDLADAIGSTLHTVSRILASWEQRGLVGGGRQRVVVLDRDGVRALADESETR